jgi:hypothetical protein
MKFFILFLFIVFLFSQPVVFAQNNRYFGTGKRYALVIGINNYEDADILSLQKAVNDAEVISKILKEQGGFNHIVTMTDKIEHKNSLYPRKDNIEDTINNMLEEVYPEDLFVLFFSGHGISDLQNQNYLVAVDAHPGRVYKNSIRIEKIIELIKARKIQRSLLIIDACRTGFSRKKDLINAKFQKYDSNEISAILYSTGLGLASYESSQTDYGVFTRFLVSGLKGEADSNCDNHVSLEELNIHLADKMAEFYLTSGLKQKPHLEFKKPLYGSLVLTKASQGACKKSFDPADSNFSFDFKFLAGLKDAGKTMGFLLLPGLYHTVNGDTSTGKYLLFSTLGGWSYLYDRSIRYNAAVKEYNQGQQVFFLMSYPTNAIHYFSVMDTGRVANVYAANARNSVVFLSLLYAYNAYEMFSNSNTTVSQKLEGFRWNIYDVTYTHRYQREANYSFSYSWRF